VNSALPYRDPLVRDLYWALTSAPLVRRPDAEIRWPDTDWFSHIGENCADRLLRLDHDPRLLRQLLDRQRDRRLGNYFETLWRFWLDNNSRYSLLHANLPLRSQGRTIGEFDLLVRDRERGLTLHWELAVKFYLGVADTTQPGNWWGPARRDRLDIKTTRLLQHQGRLSRHPDAAALLQQLGIRIDETWVILKGRLFYPLDGPAAPPTEAHPAHEHGFWLTAGALANLPQGLWLPLERQQWLAPVAGIEPAQCMEAGSLFERWRSAPLRRPLCMARIVDGREAERGFVVPDDWSGQPAQSP